MIPQKVQFFTGSILENLSYWEEKPNLNKIQEIMSRLGMLDFLKALPHGFYTQVGHNGLQLSNGQSQMLALVRLFYKNPELILMDEPDTSLDVNYAEVFKAALKELKAAGKTILLVTHNPALMELGDRIVDMGRICTAHEGLVRERE